MNKAKTIIFWTFRMLLIIELSYGALSNLTIINQGAAVALLKHLGYPAYLAGILGIAKILAVLSLIVSYNSKIVDWTFSALLVLFVGAASSHLLVADPLLKAFPAIISIVMTILYYLLYQEVRLHSKPAKWYRPQPV